MIFYTFVPSRKGATALGKREHWGAVPLDDELVKWRRVKDGPLMAAGMNGEDDLGVAVFAEDGGANLESLDVWEMGSVW